MRKTGRSKREFEKSLDRLREIFIKLKEVWEKLWGVGENFREGSGNHEKFREVYFKMGELWEN